MLVTFFLLLRQYQVGCTLRELLDLLQALEKQVVSMDIDGFYDLARCILVKDETRFDRFDRAFSEYFTGITTIDLFSKEISQDWLKRTLEKVLSEEEKAQIQALGGLDKLLETLKKRLKEQKKRHQGGSKWIGTGGTSPFGAYGYNPEGIRIGQDQNRSFRATKVWDKRQFQDLDQDSALGERQMQLVLRKLRKFARQGQATELNLAKTIHSTANQGGLLDIQLQPERKNTINLLMFFDVGGSMDPYIQQCEALFSAAKSEFKHLEFFYFHNCLYETVWKNNQRRHQETISIYDIIRRYSSDYKILFIGDATMGPYEISHVGGCIEYWNEEPGALWINRLCNHFEKTAWLNPQSEQWWSSYFSITQIQQLLNQKMYPLTLKGIDAAIQYLN